MFDIKNKIHASNELCLHLQKQIKELFFSSVKSYNLANTILAWLFVLSYDLSLITFNHNKFWYETQVQICNNIDKNI